MNAQPHPSEPPEEVLQVRRIDPAELGAKRARPATPPSPGSTAASAPHAPPPQRPESQPVRPQTPQHAESPPRHAPRVPGAATAGKAANVRAPQAAAEPKKPRLSADKVLFVLVCALLYFGWRFPTERYISPNRGVGYALGIVGGSLMLLLLVYSLRKRWPWLSFLGSTPGWFRFHMVLGVLGPLCILYHSNFSTGATNSNVALFCMLTVAGSGLIGRYIYAHIHHGLYGRKLELGELRESAESLHAQAGISFLPELAARLDAAEQRLLRAGSRLSLLGVLKPLTVAILSVHLRWRLLAYVRRALRASARTSAVIASQRKRLRLTAHSYIERRLAATRRVAAFESYERLFSLWHTLHVPLIFMMIIAAVVHVIAVHVY
ncbi:MAG TPA: hypothetical protein VLV29_05000 [Steroidobacteraceae bacterium]|nr:hypothetical protein [Steroidobacteraceae bacterium]